MTTAGARIDFLKQVCSEYGVLKLLCQTVVHNLLPEKNSLKLLKGQHSALTTSHQAHGYDVFFFLFLRARLIRTDG